VPAPVDLTTVAGLAPVRAAFAHGIAPSTSAAVARAAPGRVDDPAQVGVGILAARGLAGFALAGDIGALDNAGDLVVEGDGDSLGLELHDPTVLDFGNTGTITAIAHPDATVAARATGLFAQAPEVHVHNAGELGAFADADGGYARARGVETFADGPGSYVDNTGSITADARAEGGTARAAGIYAFGYASSSHVDNAGDVLATAAGARSYATAVNSIGYGHDTSVGNTGSLEAQATGDYAYAFGIVDMATRQDGVAWVDNGGAIAATADGTYATATGVINTMARYGAAGVANSGNIDATATGLVGATATGIYNSSYSAPATIDNAGDIHVDAHADDGVALAMGAYNHSIATATTTSTGSVSSSAVADVGLARAWGLVGLAGDTVYVVNEGDIAASAASGAGDVLAAGIYAMAGNLASVTNLGHVSADANTGDGDAAAYGALVAGGYSGIGLLVNGGDLDATATVTGTGDALAIGGYVVADVASIFNDASASASAVAADGAALARGLSAYGSYATTANYGDVVATAQADGGIATSTGTQATGYFGAATTNTGTVDSHATALGGEAFAYGTYTLGVVFGAYTTNTGAITATAQADTAVATAVVNLSTYLGNAITVNEGSIVASAEGGIAPYGGTEAVAWGVYNLSVLYDSIVDNSGSILAQATAVAELDDGFLQAKAIGAAAFNVYGYLDAGIVNQGDIGAIAVTDRGYASAWGVVARSGGLYGGDAYVDNTGTIASESRSNVGIATGIGAYVSSQGGDAWVDNAGTLSAYTRAEVGVPGQFPASSYAAGVYSVTPYGTTTIDNRGTILGHAVGYGALVGAHGIQSYGSAIAIDNAAGGDIVAIGEAVRFGFGGATGIEAHASYDVTITNAGDIAAYGTAHGFGQGDYIYLGAAGAMGIYGEASFSGNVSVDNAGNVTAVATASENVNGPSGAAGASGIFAYGKYDANVVNHGDILARATTDLGNAASYGVQVKGKYSGEVVNGAGASIVALAQTGSQAGDESAGRAVAFGTHTFGTDHAYTLNDGSVVAHATAPAEVTDNLFPTMAGAWGLDIGAYSNGIDALLVNHGDVEAVASATFGYATAYGTSINTAYEARTENSGSVLAMATAEHGDAFAVGVEVHAVHFDYYVPCTPYGCDYSNPTFTPDGGESSLANAGTIVSVANADGGVAHAYGAGVFGGFGVDVVNGGDISALADADEATATGLFAAAPYASVDVDNAGTIVAAAYGSDATAIGVSLVSGDASTLVNTGTIAAFGDGVRLAVSSSGEAIASLLNQGVLVGGIVTGGLDDRLDNAAGASWHALGDSDFGAGVDTIANAGTVLLDHATVRLGAAGEGDAFANTGLIVVAGGNTIELPGSALASDGVISFLDGSVDDTLSILGDLGGDGVLRLDASGLTGTGDRLYVGGNVTGTQVLDVNLVAAPTSASTLIPLVFVDGDSTAGSFALGEVGSGAGFVTLDFHLDAAIDAGNASADVFSLGMDVTGLNAAGALAATLAPAVQGVVDAQVGSYRQRLGAVRDVRDGVLAPWLRVFAEGGDVAATHGGDFGGTQRIGFHQSSQGWELGLETRPSGRLALGLLVASSEATQQLHGGAGRADLDARTFGLFGTWLGDGFYLDASQRWIGIDATLQSGATSQRTEATASAFSLEAGYTAWSPAGVHVVPQVQVTRARIGDFGPLAAGASSFVDDGGLSSRLRLGVAFDRTIEGGRFTWTPYGAVNAIRELDGEYDHAINDGLRGTTRTDGTSAQVELGLEARHERFSVGGSVNWTDGGAIEGRTGGQLTVRYRW
jgi:outer membrane autotransporter protein